MHLLHPFLLQKFILKRARAQVGSELDLYDVQTTYPNPSVDTYIPFLGELRDGLHFRPSDSSREMMDKVADMVSSSRFRPQQVVLVLSPGL